VSAHTPGPWEIAPHPDDAEVLEIVSEYSELPGGRKSANWIAECDAGIDSDADLQTQQATNKANARLITAAPDLLAMVQAFYEAYNGAEYAEGGWPLMDQARAAIAKAEGVA
jgi:hypothetical protein